MKYLGLIAVLAIVYVAYSRLASVAPSETATIQREMEPAAPVVQTHTSELKRPIGRTHEVLGQVKVRNESGEF